MIRVGVTGHRNLIDPVAVAAAAAEVAAQVCRDAAAHGRTVTIVSALAEGADRIVADAFLAQTVAPVSLEVVLPMVSLEYERDFPDSVAEFRRLLARASRVETVLPAPGRDAAYLAAGRRIVAVSRQLVAVWDGAPAAGRGGTAEIVDAARTAGVPVTVIEAARR